MMIVRANEKINKNDLVLLTESEGLLQTTLSELIIKAIQFLFEVDFALNKCVCT